MNTQIICKGKVFHKGETVSVFLEGKLATVKILSNIHYSSWGDFYDVEILEYPASKVVK